MLALLWILKTKAPHFVFCHMLCYPVLFSFLYLWQGEKKSTALSSSLAGLYTDPITCVVKCCYLAILLLFSLKQRSV